MLELLPRVAACSYEGDLIAAHGSSLEVIRDGKKSSEVRIFSNEGVNIYGVVATSLEGVLVFGERRLAFVPRALLSRNCDLPPAYGRSFLDQILAVKEQEGGQIAVLFTCNTACLFEVDATKESFELREKRRVQSAHTAVLLKALLVGDSWESLYTVVGTVFGEILISKPSIGPAVIHRYLGHTGMIFGLLLLANRLFSISDDRSLRVWHWPGNELEHTSEAFSGLQSDALSCAFGHSARPFSICSDDDLIYTAGIDQTVVKWSLSSDDELRVLARYPLNIGCIRSLSWQRRRLYCGSESGGFLEFDPNIEEAKSVIVETCEDLRGFARCGEDLYTVDGKGRLFCNSQPILPDRNLRFLVPPPPNCTSPFIVAYGFKNVAVFHKPSSFKSAVIEFDASSRIVSVVTCPGFVFVYTVDRIAYFLDLATGDIVELSAAVALEGISKKKPLIPSALAVHRGSSSAFLIVGSVCGHLLTASVPLENKQKEFIEMKTFQQVNRHLPDQVLSLYLDGEVMTSFTKRGFSQHWRLDVGADPPLRFLSAKSVSDVLDLEMPSAVFTQNGKNYVAGFHSTEFHLLDLSSGLSVMSLSCGGGNRPWQFTLSGSKGTFEFIKREKLISHEATLTEYRVLTENLHKAQMVFVHGVPTEGRDCDVICTGSNDTSIVFTKMDRNGNWTPLRRITEASGFQCIDSCVSGAEVLLVTGCGKGRLVVWSLSVGGLLKRDERCLTELVGFHHEEETRIVDVRFLEEETDYGRLLAAAHGDGSIEVYTVTETAIKVLHKVPPPDGSLFTKVRWVVLDGSVHLAAVSTAGKLWMWSVDKEIIEEKAEIQVAACGISSFAISPSPIPLFAAGLESGEVAFLSFSQGLLSLTSTVSYHCAIVTYVEFSEREGALSLLSTSLDCRLATHSLDSGKIAFGGAKSLSIWDPSYFTINGSRVVCVGSGVQTIEDAI